MGYLKIGKKGLSLCRRYLPIYFVAHFHDFWEFFIKTRYEVVFSMIAERVDDKGDSVMINAQGGLYGEIIRYLCFPQRGDPDK